MIPEGLVAVDSNTTTTFNYKTHVINGWPSFDHVTSSGCSQPASQSKAIVDTPSSIVK